MLSNFSFLSKKYSLLFDLGLTAEKNYHDHPPTTLTILRQFGEALTKQLIAGFGLYEETGANQIDRLDLLRRNNVLGSNVNDAFHFLRKAGNLANTLLAFYQGVFKYNG